MRCLSLTLSLAPSLFLANALAATAKDSPVTFPASGALPSKFLPDIPAKCFGPVEEGDYLFSTPERWLKQIGQILAKILLAFFKP